MLPPAARSRSTILDTSSNRAVVAPRGAACSKASQAGTTPCACHHRGRLLSPSRRFADCDHSHRLLGLELTQRHSCPRGTSWNQGQPGATPNYHLVKWRPPPCRPGASASQNRAHGAALCACCHLCVPLHLRIVCAAPEPAVNRATRCGRVRLRAACARGKTEQGGHV